MEKLRLIGNHIDYYNKGINLNGLIEIRPDFSFNGTFDRETIIGDFILDNNGSDYISFAVFNRFNQSNILFLLKKDYTDHNADLVDRLLGEYHGHRRRLSYMLEPNEERTKVRVINSLPIYEQNVDPIGEFKKNSTIIITRY